MSNRIVWLSFLTLAGWAMNVHAQQVWTYEIVGPNNEAKVTFQSPVDLTYPPPGARMPVVSANSDEASRGVPLTPQEEAVRQNGPKLIITLLPLHEAEHIGSAGRF